MFAKAVTAVILAGVALAQTFSINTPPSLQQCQPASLSWVGGTGPYILAAIPAGQVSAAALATIASSVTGTSYTWTVNLAQGTAITIKITDSLGNLAYSSPLTIQTGSGSSCLSASASGSGSGSIASTGSAASTASSAASSLSASSSSAAATAVATTSAAATTSSSNSATTTSAASTSRASTAAASSSGAAFNKASFNVPVLAMALVGGLVTIGGAVTLF